jgi:hypothetical protein
MGTFKIVNRPNYVYPLQPKFVSHVKHNSNGNVSRFKATVFAQVALQLESQAEYNNAYLPTSKFTAIYTTCSKGTSREP